jgi:hypothetical protein
MDDVQSTDWCFKFQLSNAGNYKRAGFSTMGHFFEIVKNYSFIFVHPLSALTKECVVNNIEIICNIVVRLLLVHLTLFFILGINK